MVSTAVRLLEDSAMRHRLRVTLCFGTLLVGHATAALAEPTGHWRTASADEQRIAWVSDDLLDGVLDKLDKKPSTPNAGTTTPAPAPKQPAPIVGKLTQKSLEEPINVALRASYCRNALPSLPRSATADEAAAAKQTLIKWESVEHMAMFWTAVYGGFSLIDVFDQHGGSSAFTPQELKNTIVVSCQHDLTFLYANLPRTIQEVYQRDVGSINWQRRAALPMPVKTRDTSVLTGWCETIIGESRPAMREKPGFFGHATNTPAGMSAVKRSSEALAAASVYWQKTADAVMSGTNGLDRAGILIGRDTARRARQIIVGAVKKPDQQSRALSSWLITETNLCANLASGGSQNAGLAIPPPPAAARNTLKASP